MKKYYKRLKWTNSDFRVGEIYPEDYMASKLSKYHDWPKIDTEVFEEVSEEDYRFQLAREKHRGQEEKTMTHEEAIQELKDLENEIGSTVVQKALDKAISNMKQCEVYDEPVEMEVSNSEISDSKLKVLVIGKIKTEWGNKYIQKPISSNTISLWDYAQPIKKEPLSFSLWYLNREQTFSNYLIHCSRIEELWNEYQKYRKKFEQDNK